MNGIDLTRADLNLLVVFEAVFQQRHVGSAAARLHVSSSAVSHALGRLRELFGDPLFLKAPKGVLPTARATELAPPLLEILSRVRGVLGSVEPFDPASSARRFALGTADATAAVLLPGLLKRLGRRAPRIDLSIRHLLPDTGLAELDAGAVDIVVVPLDEIPPRFCARLAYEEDFVIAARAGHPFLRSPNLRRYCQLGHIVVSITGDLHGHVDRELAQKRLARRVALSVPHFMLALAALSHSDLLAAIPRSLALAHGRRFGLGSVNAPFPMRRFQLHAIVPKAALQDAGTAWLFDLIAQEGASPRAPSRAKKQT